jgi:hypothetical protein
MENVPGSPRGFISFKVKKIIMGVSAARTRFYVPLGTKWLKEGQIEAKSGLR